MTLSDFFTLFNGGNAGDAGQFGNDLNPFLMGAGGAMLQGASAPRRGAFTGSLSPAYLGQNLLNSYGGMTQHLTDAINAGPGITTPALDAGPGYAGGALPMPIGIQRRRPLAGLQMPATQSPLRLSPGMVNPAQGGGLVPNDQLLQKILGLALMGTGIARAVSQKPTSAPTPPGVPGGSGGGGTSSGGRGARAGSDTIPDPGTENILINPPTADQAALGQGTDVLSGIDPSTFLDSTAPPVDTTTGSGEINLMDLGTNTTPTLQDLLMPDVNVNWPDPYWDNGGQ